MGGARLVSLVGGSSWSGWSAAQVNEVGHVETKGRMVTSRIIDVTDLFSMSRELTARITACHDECRNPCKGGANLTYPTHTALREKLG